MAKFYYDCPLKAAYMQKYFGMKYVYQGHTPTPLPMRKGPFYIQMPECEELLEPKQHDAGRVYEMGWSDVGEWHTNGQFFFGSEVVFRDQYTDYVIIERDEKPFFWPEREDG